MYKTIGSNIKLITLSPIPHLNISGTVTILLPKITVFGPVPAGIINTNEQAKVAGIISNIGLTLLAMAMLARTGMNMLAVAVFEFNSVNINMNPTMIKRTIKNG